MNGFDTVVVGGGTSGGTLAARLSEDPDRRVLLLEAGEVPRSPDQFPPDLLDIGIVPGARLSLAQSWRYPAQLSPERPYTVLRGRILGGSSTINGGYFIRARREDFDAWSARDAQAWGYERVLPFLRALETDLDLGDSAIHGRSGPVPVQRTPLTSPATRAFHAAAAELGFGEEADKNDQGVGGIGPVPLNRMQDIRANVGLTYVLPALSRSNLTVWGGAVVQRVLIDHRRAIGVQVALGGAIDTVRAGEVVLAAGAFASAQLLLLSGVGPREELATLSIPVARHAPGVGRGFSDHPQVAVEWQPHGPLEPESVPFSSALNFRSKTGPASGDLQLLPVSVPMGVLTGAGARPDGPRPVLVSTMSARSSGTLRLVSADPARPPRIDYHYLETPDERRKLREAVRTAAALLSTRSFGDVSAGISDPTPRDLDDDDALDRWMQAGLGTAVHACGTAAMGAADEAGSVVDQYGRVHGIAGLRVADTSILPRAPLRGPANTAVLIGELVADAMRRDLR